MKIKKVLGKCILKVGGWTDYYPNEYVTDKCLIITAPHTSVWDYLFTFAAFWKREVKIKFLLSDSKSKIHINNMLKLFGGVKVQRNKGSAVDCSVHLINKYEKIVLLVLTEGSRKKVDKWKTGFYHIAKITDVPVALGYLDYEDKIAGIGDLFHVSGNIKTDLKKIERFYKNFTPKNPKNYNKKIF
ncbi:1-acyl-sn-glycerol-3-phosphate acyltransferase [Urechidicola croceus]|uniref:1-acyl-sn-glycerol-3-phosphate acyltransferase n=1 Tax=Urechidicola croceus TaxID=1850246 RepID=UPI0012EAD631|nr:1-acyl-sn-glycerol-3-phosphate acyltransferase [Urechidicola croceus]